MTRSASASPESSDDFFADNLTPAPVLVILRGTEADRTLELCRRAWDLGIALVEIPLQGPESLSALRAAAELAAARHALVGAGTIVSTDLVDQAADAGAAFTVAPGWNRGVCDASLAAGLPHLPGVSTPSEVQRVLEFGLHWHKLFPASLIGPDWIRAVHGPFPGVQFVATGGIGAPNAAGFLDAGAAAVSLGSSFAGFNPAAVRALVSRSTR